MDQRARDPGDPRCSQLLYIIGVVAALPGSALTLAAGALFGSVLGLAVVSLASTIGATLAFLVSRYFARRAVVNWLSDNQKFQKLDRMTEKHGPVIVALTRLVPLFPFNLLNYGFGLTKVPLKVYVFWSWLCMLPGTVLYVVGSDAVFKAIRSGEAPWVLIGALGATGVVLFFLVNYARKKLKNEDAEDEKA